MELFAYLLIIPICFFILYILSRNDFVLLRQNISASQILDTLFLSLVSSFLFGRAFYMVNNFKIELLDLLPFFHVIRYPGLSIFGIFFGGAVCLYLIYLKKKGFGRIADIYAVSFFPLFIISLLFENYAKVLYVPIILIVLSLILFVTFIRFHYKYILRDGSVAICFLLFVCITTVISQMFSNAGNAILFNLSILALLSLILIPFGLILLLINQRRKTS